MDHCPLIRRPGSLAHQESCPSHRDGSTKVCWGKLKNGEPCTNKAILGNIDETPTCGVHRRLAKRSSSCIAQLPCGVWCGRLCVFQIHGFQLCALHQDTSTACYLTKIPIELRLRIFGYLLPSNPIETRKDFKEPRGSVSFLRVNRQFHDEGTQLLYGTGPFVIEISKDGLSMGNCHPSTPGYQPYVFREPAANQSPHNLQNYQMQLMLLEQQNKRRLLAAWQEGLQLRNNGGPSRPQPPPCTNGSIYTPSPLASKYFNMIHSFTIEIHMGLTKHHPTPSDDPVVLQKMVLDYCDHLHRLVSKLETQRLSRIEIKLRFGGTFAKWEGVVSAAQMLLQPFRRIRNVTHADVVSVTMNRHGSINDEIELVHCLLDYSRAWSTDLKSSEPAEKSAILDVYWQLEDMVKALQRHYKHDHKLERLESLLHGARVAREDVDWQSLKVIWGEVMDLYFNYQSFQSEFRANMGMAIDRISKLLVSDD